MTGSSSNRLRSSLAALTLAATTLAAYARVWLSGETWAARDHQTLTVPARAYLAESLRSGRLPHWWDGVGMGTPFLANPMHGALYPPAWIAALFPMPLGADVVIALHGAWLAFGVALWSRRLGAGPWAAAFAGAVALGCGYTASMAPNGVPFMTLAWLPWAGWAADRVAVEVGRQRLAAAMVLALVFGFLIVSGDPAGAVTGGLLVGGVALVRGNSRPVAVAAVIVALVVAVALAAVQVVPALALLGDSVRAGGMDPSGWSMHPLRVFEWVWPGVFGDPTDASLHATRFVANSSSDPFMAPAWSASVYVGAPVLVLAVASGRRALAALSLLFVLLALGTYTPLYELYRAAVPPEQVIRYPERHLAGALCLWWALAGVGLERWFIGAPSRTAVNIALGTAAAMATLALASWQLAGPFFAGVAPVGELDTNGAAAVATRGIVLAAGVMALFAGALFLRMRRETYVAAGVVGLAVAFHLIVEAQRFTSSVERAAVQSTPALLADVAVAPDDAPAPRLYRHRSMVPWVPDKPLISALFDSAVANVGTRFGVAYVPGYDPALPGRLQEIWEQGADRHARRLLSAFDVELAMVPAPAASAPGFELVAPSEDPRFALVRVTERRPRAFATSRWRRFSSEAELRADLFASAFDPMSVRLIGDAAAGPEAGAASICRREAVSPERVRLDCTARAPGFAVLLDAWAPGWSAELDGIEVEIERAEGLVRAVAIPAGSHAIEFRYRTPGFAEGVLISMGAVGFLLVLLGFLAWPRARDRHHTPITAVDS